MSEVVINTNPEPVGNIGGVAGLPSAPPQQLMALLRYQQQRQVPFQTPYTGTQMPVPIQGPGIPGLSAGGYPMGVNGPVVPTSMGGSIPLTVGRPEAVTAERQIPIAGQGAGRINVPVDGAGRLGSIPVPPSAAASAGVGTPLSAGIPTFGNAGAIAQAPAIPAIKPSRKR